MQKEPFLPSFVVAHVRGSTPREISTQHSNAVELEIDADLSTVTVDPHNSVLVDAIVDGRSVDKAETKLNELWSHMKPALWGRLDAAGEAAVMMCGPSKSGKSSLLFGNETDEGSPAAGLIPRFVRSAFESGGRAGALPSAMEVTMVHVSEEVVFDLLNPVDPTTDQGKQKLKLRWSTSLQAPFVPHLSSAICSNPFEVLQTLHEGLAMRALHFHHTGHNVNSHACHLIVTLTLLERPPARAGPVAFEGGGKVSFVEVGDFSFEPWSHGGDAHSDRLKEVWRRTERSRRGLGKCARALAEQGIEQPESWPPDLAPSDYQACALTFLLSRPLFLGVCLWVGCFLPSATPEGTRSQAELTSLLLDAKSAHTHPMVPGQTQILVTQAASAASSSSPSSSSSSRPNTSSKQGKHGGGGSGGGGGRGTVSAAATAWAEARTSVLAKLDQEVARAETAYEICVNPVVNVRTGIAEPIDEVRASRLLSKTQALQTLRASEGLNLEQKMETSDEAAQKRREWVGVTGMSMCHHRPLSCLKGTDPSDLQTLELRYGPFLRVLCVDDLCSGRLMAPLLQGERTVLGRALQPPNVFVPSKFVRDYHVGISCDLETCALELRVLRDRSKVFLNAKAIVFDDGSNGSNGGGIVVVGADGEEKTLSPGVVPVRHGDCLCLMEASAIMFEVVHNQDLVNRLRLGEVTLESLNDGHVPSLAWDWNLEVHREVSKEIIQEHLDERKEDAEAVPEAAKRLIALLGGKINVLEAAPAGLEDEVSLLMALVAECNLMATYMDRDYLFEVQVKAFSVYGLEHPHQGYGGRHGEAQKHHSRKHHHHKKKSNHHGGKEDPEAWVFVDSVSDLVPDALWPAAKFAARVPLLREAFQAWVECGEDNDEYIRRFPPDLDPFYDPPKQKLLGVAYCYLASLNYLIPISEAPQIVSFKGEVVGELEVEVHSMLDSELMAAAAEGQVFHTEEPTLKQYIGELLHLRFRIRQAHGLPKKLATNCFVTFKFFMEGEPLKTGTCGAKATAPKWDQSITVEQIVTEDFLDYIMNEALEIEVWGGPDNHLSGEDVKSAPLIGFDKVEFSPAVPGARGGALASLQEEEEGELGEGGDDGGDDGISVSEDGSDADVLRDRITELQASLDEARREAKLHSDLALSLVRGFDEAAATSLSKTEASQRVPTVLRLSHDRIAKLEAKQKGQLTGDEQRRREEEAAAERADKQDGAPLSRTASLSRSVSRKASLRKRTSTEDNGAAENGSSVCALS